MIIKSGLYGQAALCLEINSACLKHRSNLQVRDGDVPSNHLRCVQNQQNFEQQIRLSAIDVMADLRRAGTAARRHRDDGKRRRIPVPVASRRVGVLPRWLLATRRAVVYILKTSSFVQNRVLRLWWGGWVSPGKTPKQRLRLRGTSTCERAVSELLL